jgi:hypothetical protein
MRRKTLFLALAGLMGVLGVAIAGCSGGSDPAFKAGPLACDGLGTKSYHYTVNVKEEVKPLESTPLAPVTSAPGPPAATLTWDIQGVVQGGNSIGSIDAKQHNATRGGSGDVETIYLESGVGYYTVGRGWQASSGGPSFQPLNLCNALSADADTTKLGEGVPETVNGVASRKFSFQGLSSLFVARQPDFGGGSDAGTYVRTLDGSVWVAEKGNLITKLDLTGTGHYENGASISVTVKFEVSDLGSDVKVRAPV